MELARGDKALDRITGIDTMKSDGIEIAMGNCSGCHLPGSWAKPWTFL
jgi:hypothetical protein